MISPQDLAESLEFFCENCPSSSDCPQYCEKLAAYKKRLLILYDEVDE